MERILSEANNLLYTHGHMKPPNPLVIIMDVQNGVGNSQPGPGNVNVSG